MKPRKIYPVIQIILILLYIGIFNWILEPWNNPMLFLFNTILIMIISLISASFIMDSYLLLLGLKRNCNRLECEMNDSLGICHIRDIVIGDIPECDGNNYLYEMFFKNEVKK